VWEGLWTGLDILQVVIGTLHGMDRCYLIVSNSGTIELWEILPDSEGLNDVQDASGPVSQVVQIESSLATKRYNFGDPFRLKKLIMSEVYVDEVVDNISLSFYYKPDQYPNWILWTTVPVCASVSQCNPPTPAVPCKVWAPNAMGYAARIRLPRPPEGCNEFTNGQLDRAYEFQFKIEMTGHCRIRKFRPHAIIQGDAMEGECPGQATCVGVQSCGDDWLTYSSHA